MTRQDFPIFKNNPNLIYLDSAATTQKPQSVIDAEHLFYEKNYASVHRGVYRLSHGATSLYEGTREKVRQFLNAKHDHEIIFTKGTTESINLLAHSFGLANFKSGDEIILSVSEHHANIVPWQQVCEKTGAKLVIIPLHDSGELNFDAYLKALNPKTKLVAITHISNVLGIINPVKKIVEAAHANNTPVLLDGAQAVAHIPVDVQALDCDFYVLSAHKLYGPSGVGILYGKEQHLEKMTPYQTGGHMIRSVSFEKTEFGDLPLKFEAGTPNIAGVVGLGAAIDYITAIATNQNPIRANGSASASDRETCSHTTTFNHIRSHEQKLLSYAIPQLQQINGLKIYGLPANLDNKIGVLSFALNTAHPHDIATILDQSNIAMRAGHHCTMPLMHYFNVPALARISFGIYSTPSDIDALMIGLQNTQKIFHE